MIIVRYELRSNTLYIPNFVQKSNSNPISIFFHIKLSFSNLIFINQNVKKSDRILKLKERSLIF
ncbi:MAG: hypothetical protein V7K69_24925 [Nostoc sp.]